MEPLFRKIGKDVRVHPTAIIKYPELVSIGNHVSIDIGVTFSTGMTIGDYIHVSPYVCTIGGKTTEVTLEDFVFVAAGTKIVTGSEDYTGEGLVGATIPAEYRKLIFKNIIFRRFSGCGVNCSILPGVTLAEGSVLGANSLLTKDTEPWTIYVGSPARPIKARKKHTILDYAKRLGYNV